MALLGLLIKMLYPAKKIILITHGIEVWNIKSVLKNRFLTKVDLILSVSHYTKNRMITYLSLKSEKMSIFHNTLDPFFQIPDLNGKKPAYLLERYGFSAADKVILTVARLSGTEIHKGYDKVIKILPEVLKAVPHAKYLIGGKYNDAEKERLELLIKNYGVKNQVILTGYIPDEELSDHYLLADLFIMPSKKEGFGIVFIEALACGLAVIAGNQDGSAEALLNGRLGTLVNPDDLIDIENAVINNLMQNNSNKARLQHEVLEHFGYEVYKNRMRNLFNN
jgi:glycosyltransferase involved in cell wall biosynthesis